MHTLRNPKIFMQIFATFVRNSQKARPFLWERARAVRQLKKDLMISAILLLYVTLTFPPVKHSGG